MQVISITTIPNFIARVFYHINAISVIANSISMTPTYITKVLSISYIAYIYTVYGFTT
jgi:hypothetical protein